MRFSILFLFLSVFCAPQVFAATDSVRVVFYNVENFFDARDDTLKQDEEFLPGGLRGWSVSRFYAKAGKIARVIAATGAGHFPELVGMAEVENDYCLKILTCYSPLKNAAYSFIHEESPDARGVDVCLLYNRYHFQPLSHQALQIRFPADSLRKTRDVLYVHGVLNNRDTLHVYVCHFPSRLGGEIRSEFSRRWVAQTIRQHTNQILTNGSKAKVLIMGDFNDYPSNLSLRRDLSAKLEYASGDDASLYNLMAAFMQKTEIGTHKISGVWGCLDQFIVSGTLYKQVIRTAVFAPEYLLQPDETYFGTKPFRTYEGMRYTGGYSDHLPVYTDLRITAP